MIIRKLKGFSMKSLYYKRKYLLLLGLALVPSYVFVQTPKNISITIPANPCSTYTQKTLESLEYTTKHAKRIVHENQSLISMSDQVCEKLTTLGQSPEVQNLLTPEKTTLIKQIVDNHVRNVNDQINILFKEGIEPELQLMEQRIDDLLKDDAEKIKDLSQRVETTIKEFLKDEKVQDSLKTIKAEGKKLEKHFKKIFK